jgi:hypothetical protein
VSCPVDIVRQSAMDFGSGQGATTPDWQRQFRKEQRRHGPKDTPDNVRYLRGRTLIAQRFYIRCYTGGFKANAGKKTRDLFHLAIHKGANSCRTLAPEVSQHVVGELSSDRFPALRRIHSQHFYPARGLFKPEFPGSHFTKHEADHPATRLGNNRRLRITTHVITKAFLPHVGPISTRDFFIERYYFAEICVCHSADEHALIIRQVNSCIGEGLSQFRADQMPRVYKLLLRK